MESPAVVFCDWTLFDAMGRFIMFCFWGYAMGKSISHSKTTTWMLTFVGTLACAFLHTWMQNWGQYSQHFGIGQHYTPIVSNTDNNPVFYFIKVFFFYLTASTIGYRAGRKTAKKTKAELDRVNNTMEKWKVQGLIKKED